jgi:prepilin-type N-terminal cleavage/methylation domain-containing protein
MSRATANTHSGFTIAELSVVIVVIAILASIVLFAYPGYQMRARDSQRRSDLGQLSAALNAYVLQKNTFIETGSGCGALGNGNGWLGVGPTATYPKSITTCLSESGVTKTNFIDPLNCISDSGGVCGGGSVPAQGYMKATCLKNGVKATYVFAHLETQPRNDTAIDALCDNGTVDGFTTTTQKWGTVYGMNYYVTVR